MSEHVPRSERTKYTIHLSDPSTFQALYRRFFQDGGASASGEGNQMAEKTQIQTSYLVVLGGMQSQEASDHQSSHCYRQDPHCPPVSCTCRTEKILSDKT